LNFHQLFPASFGWRTKRPANPPPVERWYRGLCPGWFPVHRQQLRIPAKPISIPG
jgi:hypothetical protein